MQRGGEIVGRSTTLDITSTVVPPQPTQPAVAPRSPFVAAAAAVASAVDHKQHAVAAADAEQTEGQSAAGAGGGGGGPTAMDTHDCDGHAHLHHHTSNEDGHGAICTAATASSAADTNVTPPARPASYAAAASAVERTPARLGQPTPQPPTTNKQLRREKRAAAIRANAWTGGLGGGVSGSESEEEDGAPSAHLCTLTSRSACQETRISSAQAHPRRREALHAILRSASHPSSHPPAASLGSRGSDGAGEEWVALEAPPLHSQHSRASSTEPRRTLPLEQSEAGAVGRAPPDGQAAVSDSIEDARERVSAAAAAATAQSRAQAAFGPAHSRPVERRAPQHREGQRQAAALHAAAPVHPNAAAAAAAAPAAAAAAADEANQNGMPRPDPNGLRPPPQTAAAAEHAMPAAAAAAGGAQQMPAQGQYARGWQGQYAPAGAEGAHGGGQAQPPPAAAPPPPQYQPPPHAAAPGPVPPAAADAAAAAPQEQAAGGDNAQAIAIATAVAAALAANRPQPRRKLPRQLEWPELSRYQMYLGAQGGEQDFVTWWVGYAELTQHVADDLRALHLMTAVHSKIKDNCEAHFQSLGRCPLNHPAC